MTHRVYSTKRLFYCGLALAGNKTFHFLEVLDEVEKKIGHRV